MKKLLCIFCALFAIAGCDSEKSDKPVVKIAFLYPMSGDGAIFGDTAKKISDWYISEFEKNNPNAKYKYKAIFEDAQWSASKTATLAQKVISVDHADAMLSMTSSQGMVMNPIAEQNKVIQLSFAADPKAAKGDFNFRIATSAKNVAERTFEYMNKNKLKTFSTVVLTSDAGSVAVIDEFKRVASKNKNVKMKSAYSINPGDKNFDVMLTKIKSEKPDLLVIEALPPESDCRHRENRRHAPPAERLPPARHTLQLLRHGRLLRLRKRALPDISGHRRDAPLPHRAQSRERR